MPRVSGRAWAIKYDKSKSDRRFLVSMPQEMLDDIAVVARLHGMSRSEYIRRAIAHALRAQVINAPDQVKLKGRAGGR